MTDRSTGPVKPPVIDLTARNTNGRQEERSTSAEATPASRRRSNLGLADANWPLLAGVALVSALLGTALTYIIANALPLPSRGPAVPDLTPQLTAQTERLDAMDSTIAELQSSTTRTQVSLDATIAQLDSGLATLTQSVDDVRGAIDQIPPPVDLEPIATQIRTLRAQVDAIAAGASGADAGAIAQSIASLETGISSLTSRLDGVDSAVSTLRSDLEAARQSLAAHIDAALPNEVGPALKLPLILSGLEGAFAAGKPFAAELETLRTVLPDFAVPEVLADASAAGLIRPDALDSKFQLALPEILAARDTANQDWTQNAVDWAKSLLALRPAEEIEGDSPEAVISRLEGAMERRDYLAAAGLLEALPETMQVKAADIAADIRALAAANQLVADLRARALTTTTTAS